MANNTSQHILPTAANLLGFCVFVITSLHVTDKASTGIIDEFVSCIALLLMFSCLLSFISIRTTDAVREKKLEAIADISFAVSLGGIAVIVMLPVFDFVK